MRAVVRALSGAPPVALHSRAMRVALVATVLALPSLSAAQAAPWQRAEAVRGAVDFNAPGAGRVRLTLESAGVPQRVVVEHRGDTPRGPRVLGAGTCQTPCALYVTPAALTLRAEAWRLRDTELTLDAPERPSVLRLRAASRTQWNLGVGLTGAGATVFLALAGYALAAQTTSGASLPTEAAIGGAVVSVALLAAGVPLLVFNRTGVASLTTE